MKFEFAPVSTLEVKHVSLMNEMEHKLNSFFQSKNYGADLKEIYIGVVAVSPRFERFFKKQKPKYISNPINYMLDSVNYSVDRALKYYINLNLERFNNSDEDQAREMLKKELLGSISLFDKLKRKIKDFNVTPFREDMRMLLEVES